jgi:hypothetical protein
MKLTHITLLSIGTLVVLTGCYERGEIIPPSVKHIKKKKKKIFYDFPVLKLSAKTNGTDTQKKVIKKKSDTSDVHNESSSLRFPKMTKKPTEKKVTVHNNADTKKIKNKKTVIQNKTSTPNSVKKTSNSAITMKKDALKRVIAETKILQEKDKPKVKVSSKPKIKKDVKKKSIRKRTPHKNSESTQIPILSSIFAADVSLQDIPILNKILPKPSNISKGRIKKNTRRQSNKNAKIPTLDSSSTPAVFNANNNSTSFSGGTSARGLDMTKIRVETDNYQTNIILDSYLWVKQNDIPTEASAVSGTYLFKYEPYNDRIIGHIKGYNTFSALLTKKDDMLKNNPMIKDIYIDRYIGDDGIKFIIELKKKAKINIIDVEDPGSIIIELYPPNSK